MNDFFSLFQYTFFQNALIASLLTSILAAMIGTYIVARKNVFISGGITHASFGGIGIAYYLGLNPFLGAAVFAVLTGTGIEWISNKGKVREDSAIAILWSLGMALGIIFVFLTPGYAPNLMSFLFGSILSVGQADIYMILILTAISALLFTVYYRPILYTAFDPEFSKINGLKANFYRYLMAALVSLAIVVSIRTMGIILLLSLFTIPQATSMIFTHNFRKIIGLSAIFGIIGSFAGLYVAHAMDIPSGAAIIFILTIQYLLIKGIELVLMQIKEGR
ncbi:metal ABC transporter permease [Xiashengella succiniciproducens]|jgi:zinc transport system permease protein|uniref:Metal ABC transporter permease n=1 Tax=Xiashengella succiniciproducens TaxID=2949635 RepID=A0A9J6ZQ42_9BACT|nr:metal ABC transporter permease [Alkaliflexus sp. Ai-910]URW80010.1 metal ABC transporter permease [Alkaliflexus sp. Ai-910]HHU00865.1 metal ABC transporter permease [Bacteroidales bacterium]